MVLERDSHSKGRKGNEKFKAAYVTTNHEIMIPENNYTVPQTPLHPASLNSPWMRGDPSSTASSWG